MTISVAIKDLRAPISGAESAEHALPRYATAGAAGLDLCAHIESPRRVAPGERVQIPTGLAIAIPEGFVGDIRPRSGLALRHGVTVLNSPGTIDADYRGELLVLLINHGQAPFDVQPGDRIAQIVFLRCERVAWERVPQLPETARGTAGYGSTGR
jgi:dUTP pyrophosphatase